MSTVKFDTLEDLSAGESVDATYLVHGTLKAWSKVPVSGGTPSIADSLNTSSVTDNGVGNYTNNFTSAFASATHSEAGMITSDGSVRTSGSAASSTTYQTQNFSGTNIDITYHCNTFGALA